LPIIAILFATPAFPEPSNLQPAMGITIVPLPRAAPGDISLEKRLLLLLLAFALFALGVFIYSRGGLPNWLPR
jgi:hypothetical protein